VLFSGGLELVEQRGLADPSRREQEHMVGLEPVPKASLHLVPVVEVLTLDRAPDAVADVHLAVLQQIRCKTNLLYNGSVAREVSQSINS
jgi:hypothetical protein